MAFSAWFWVDEATWPWTARWVSNASTSTAAISAGRRFLWKRMKRRIQST